MTQPADIWTVILAKLEASVGPDVCSTWFRPLTVVGCDEGGLRLHAPNETFRAWLEENYGALLRQTVTEGLGSPREVAIAVPSPAAPDTELLPVVRAAALERASPGSHWLIDHLWTRGAVGIVGAPPKSLKSWLALDMAVAVAAGVPCLGTFPVSTPGPVLLYAAEETLPAVRARLESLARHYQLDLAQIPVWVITADALRLDRADDQRKLEATVLHYQPRLLVLDPLIRLHTLDENASGPMAALLGFFRLLQRKTGTAIALVHHTRKNPAAGGAGYSLRGSSDLYAWLDCFLHLERRRGQLTLKAEHRSAAPFGPVPLQLTQPDGAGTHLQIVTETAAAAGAAPPDGIASRLLDVLAASPNPLSIAELRSRLHVRNQRLLETLRQLVSQRRVSRVDGGYAAAPPMPR
ncbi:MAG: hypothetical protein FJW90_11850 [Actinobacteria bacterium]|nr:hypothetical protein [Actinomycetota bacterium]